MILSHGGKHGSNAWRACFNNFPIPAGISAQDSAHRLVESGHVAAATSVNVCHESAGYRNLLFARRTSPDVAFEQWADWTTCLEGKVPGDGIW